MKDKVTQRMIRSAARELAKVMRPKAIYLFGSYAWGKPTNDSDVDFCLVFEKVRPSEKVSLMQKAQKTLAKYSFAKDIIVRDSAKMQRMLGYVSPLEAKIQSHGVKLYEAKRRSGKRVA
jgi:predicted nucleotidyltransferase